MDVIDIEIAPLIEDVKKGSDMVIRMNGNDVSLRIRDMKYFHIYGPDWSVRYHNHGFKTEYRKIMEGTAPSWYLMGWANSDEEYLKRYMFIDVYKSKGRGLLHRGTQWIRPNGDGTTGMYIPFNELNINNCIIKHNMEQHEIQDFSLNHQKKIFEFSSKRRVKIPAHSGGPP
jgi:hypothetical protein